MFGMKIGMLQSGAHDPDSCCTSSLCKSATPSNASVYKYKIEPYGCGTVGHRQGNYRSPIGLYFMSPLLHPLDERKNGNILW